MASMTIGGGECGSQVSFGTRSRRRPIFEQISGYASILLWGLWVIKGIWGSGVGCGGLREKSLFFGGFSWIKRGKGILVCRCAAPFSLVFPYRGLALSGSAMLSAAGGAEGRGPVSQRGAGWGLFWRCGRRELWLSLPATARSLPECSPSFRPTVRQTIRSSGQTSWRSPAAWRHRPGLPCRRRRGKPWSSRPRIAPSCATSGAWSLRLRPPA